MAITALSPETSTRQPIQDPVSIKEAILQFREAKIVVGESTLVRWVKEDRIRREWRGKKTVMSYSDLLEAYARRYPAPGVS